MDFSPITPQLFIGTTPTVDDYQHLHELGVRLIINMRAERRPFCNPTMPSLNLLWLPTFDNPLFLIPIRTLQRGVLAALETIQTGGKVYTHCQHGRHRGVAMGAAILVALGYDPFDAMELIKERRTISDPFVFYIRSRILRFARQWISM